MATIEHLIRRPDGSEVKIVAQEFFSISQDRSVGVYVLRRGDPNKAWHCCSDRPHPNWRSMSVAEYMKHGRSEMLQTVTPGEILKVTSYLSKHSGGLLYPE